jgi:cupin 2 domain-containing protein
MGRKIPLWGGEMMNLLDLPEKIGDFELIEALLPDKGVLIERIISKGQSSPPGFWYDQVRDEFVLVLQGEACLVWSDGREKRMRPGDWLVINAHDRHRVEWTSSDPACVWLTVHGKLY